jgi:hypothetical protein
MPGPVVPVTHIHLIFKTHLDVGFTDLGAAVVQRYLDDYIPKALDLARGQRETGGEAFVWTTGSWMVDHALTAYRGARRRQLETAIAAGDIRWHALPFTCHSELMDSALVRRGLGISAGLDRRFGRHTIAAKMTDVPGHTGGLVPLLAEAGVKLLHIGVNPGSKVPAVPTVFRWQAGSAEVAVIYSSVYGDVAVPPGSTHALAFGFTGDNHGPPTPAEIAKDYADLRTRFPGAAVSATSLDTFAAVLARQAKDLPVVDDELGDTWIHGAGSDPGKIAGFRALQALHARWSSEPGHDPARIDAFGRRLLMLPEHTCGMDVKRTIIRCMPEDTPRIRAASATINRRTYRSAGLRTVLRTGPYRKLVDSWREQRGYLDAAVAGLGRSREAVTARAALAAAKPQPRDDRGLRPVPGHHLETARWRVAIDPASGAVIELTDRASGRRWADRSHPLARFRYQAFTAADFARWHREYNRNLNQFGWWIHPDFGKPGMDTVPTLGGLWTARDARVRQRPVDGGVQLVVDLTMPSQPVRQRGCPATVRLELVLPDAVGPVRLALQWSGKNATRLPEAAWLDLNPRGVAANSWRLRKLGMPVDPQRIVHGGGRYLHAVDTWVEADGFRLATLDAPLIAPGGPRLLRSDDRPVDLAKGVSLNLHNNLWGTNFPMWYGEAARFRLDLHLG